MRLPAARGPYSAAVIGNLRGEQGAPRRWSGSTDTVADGDFQLALWVLYALHYRGFDDTVDDAEWDPVLINARRDLERGFEAALLDSVRPHLAAAQGSDIVERIESLIDSFSGESVADFLKRHGTAEQIREVLAHRSVLQLKEADPYSWVIPRLSGTPKVALVELQFDEYGDGRPERLHQRLYERTMREVGLDADFGAYVDVVCPQMLAADNAVTFFGLHRRLRGAAMGHLAAFESTSALPSRKYAIAMRKAGFSEAAAFYFDEHAEADAVHEQLATRGVCGALISQEPSLEKDVLFGAASCLLLDERFGMALLDAWNAGGRLIPAEAMPSTRYIAS